MTTQFPASQYPQQPPHETQQFQPQVPQAPTPVTSTATLLGLFAVGAAVSVALGVYGNLHTPTGVGVSLAGFTTAQAAKAWLGTGAVLLAIVQLVSALAMYGKIKGLGSGATTAMVHRWSGRLAFLLVVPVAVHCLYALGFQTYDARTLTHSLFGCFFFGAFAVKMLALPRRGLAGWVLPTLGGLVFTGLVVLWLTSSYWFFVTIGVQR
jgi:hypothetical protein